MDKLPAIRGARIAVSVCFGKLTLALMVLWVWDDTKQQLVVALGGGVISCGKTTESKVVVIEEPES